MSKSHVVTLGKGFTAGTIKIEDSNTGGELIIRHIVTEKFVRTMTENNLDPLVEVYNGLQESIIKGNVSFTLIGKDNLIVFRDDETPILEGGIELNNVAVSNPLLRNVTLTDIEIPFCTDLTIISSIIDGLYVENKDPLYIQCCYINDQFGLDYKPTKRGQYLMNKFIPEA